MRSTPDPLRRRWLEAALALPAAVAATVWLAPPARAREGRAHGGAVLDVREFGARGDGQGDDTRAFQRALDALPASGGTVTVPSGRYRIDALRSIRMRSRQHLKLADDAHLLAIPNGAERAYVITVHGVSDVEISGGRIIGERDRHLGASGEWGHGIMIRGSSRVTVRDIHISRCWGDGISIGAINASRGRPVVPSRDVAIARVTSTGNRRQGLTVGRSDRVHVYDCEFSHTGGTPPAAGIDVEPDAGYGARDVLIERCRVIGNRGPGIQLYRRVRDVVIRDCTIADNRGHGILIVEAGDVAISGNRLLRNAPYGIGFKGAVAGVRVHGNWFTGTRTPSRRRPAGEAPPARHIRVTEGVTGLVVSPGNRFD